MDMKRLLHLFNNCRLRTKLLISYVSLVVILLVFWGGSAYNPSTTVTVLLRWVKRKPGSRVRFTFTKLTFTLFSVPSVRSSSSS